MKYSEFDYTKDSGTKSNRKVLVLETTDDKVKGIDLSELKEGSTEFFDKFVVEFNIMEKRHSMEFDTLQESHRKEFENILSIFDLKHRFRQFKTTNMSNITTGTI